ncbi:hypothetical protein F4604DRAFT_1918942 [Suillus subluteus]|nr:hypothetical protein F4604DRAFT_1918942 [Suillus subluteus]
MDFTRADMDAHTTRTTPPLSDSGTTVSTCVDSVLSSSLRVPNFKVMSPLSPPQSLTSSFTFEPQFAPTQRDDKQKLSSRNDKRLRRKHTRTHPSSGSQDRIHQFREKMRARFPPRLLCHAPHHELDFAKKHIEHSSHKDFTQEDLHEGMDLLEKGLSRLSDRTFRKAALEEQEEEFKLIESEMNIYRQIVCARGLPALQGEKDYLQAVFAENLDDFDVANEQCRQFMAHANKRAIAAPFGHSSDTELSSDELLEDCHSSAGLSDDSLIYDA